MSRRRRSDLFRKYDRNTLPVVDTEEKLLGIVTIDDMLDVQERRQTTEDIQKLGGLEALEEPYMDAPLLRLSASARSGSWCCSSANAHRHRDGSLSGGDR